MAGDNAKLFILFYDSFVIELLNQTESRGKMLCYDDVLSWIRRERPEAEEDWLVSFNPFFIYNLVNYKFHFNE